MDVLGILRENGKDLLPEEMDLLRTELDTGEYEAEYIAECRKLISELTNWAGKGMTRGGSLRFNEIHIPEERNSDNSEEKTSDDSGTETSDASEEKTSGSPGVNTADTPREKTSVIQSFSNISDEEIIAVDLERMRRDREYRSLFKKYVRESKVINEDFVVAHFTLFKDVELNAMLACIPFSEEFLEHYFSVLDPKAIALHQRFSENFFIKHFSELDAATVLTRGVNPWRIKTLRSKMLSNFLRIKGVKV